MGEFGKYNAENVLKEVEKCINELESMNGKTGLDYDYKRIKRFGYGYSKPRYSFLIDEIYEELSIFDWWNETLSLSQLKQMKSFLKTAIKLGFCGYVCFKVGASGCANGMWANKEESTNGHSPDGDVFYRSFTPDYITYSAQINGEWIPNTGDEWKHTLEEVKEFIRKGNR